MNRERLEELANRYRQLRIGVVGDFFLDRYLHIDAAKAEKSIETGLPVHNVVEVRSQPGAAGTIVNNLVALGVGTIHAVGFCGEDGEGWELLRALRARPGVRLDHFIQTSERATFTYTKPLLMESAGPRELSRLDIKNWTLTPAALSERMIAGIETLVSEARIDGIIVMDQVSIDGTGVVTSAVRGALATVAKLHPALPILADSRRALGDFANVMLKMNAAELAVLTGGASDPTAEAAQLAQRRGQPVVVTLAERGLLGALPGGETFAIPAWSVRGPIDVVGAGDAVTANTVAALAAGASLREALELANAAASIVIHQLGTTGTATPAQLAALLAKPHAG
jgi:rfaE bifunctional protein kinase chain/domain